MATGPSPHLVDAPPVRPSLNGLVEVARRLDLLEMSLPRPVDDTTEDSEAAKESRRWEMGYEFRPDDACVEPSLWDPECTDPPYEYADATADDPEPANPKSDPENLNDLIEVAPFMVEHAFEECTTGFQEIDYEGRARRAVELGTSKAIEQELWSAALLPGNKHLSQFSDVGGGTVHTLLAGMGLLGEALAGCGGGGRGMINLPVRAGEMLTTSYSFPNENGVLHTTGRGDYLVIGDGYSGDGPSGAPTAGSMWVVATGLIQVRLSEVQVLTTDLTRALTFDPATGKRINTFQFRAERMAGASWGCCGAFGVLVDVSGTGPGAP